MRTPILSSPKTPTPHSRNSYQLAKSAPLVLYPTPQSSVDIASPRKSISSPSSGRSSPSSKNRDTSSDGSDSDDEIAEYLRAHDELRKLYPHDDKVPHSRICVLGAQSAGKSSFLSSLTGIDLYCAVRKATSCRTLISSRRGGIAFKAEIFILVLNIETNEARSVPFATSISDVAEMGEICHWAGEEARRTDNDLRDVRPWSELVTMDNEGKKDGEADWPEFTRNVVVINVIGPDRPNFDIEDLPGLNGHHIPFKMVSDCISQPQNLIVLCLSAGSKDASLADPEIKLARKFDPTGARTIGVITRADQLIPTLEVGSTFIDYLLDLRDHLGEFRPQGLWWPLRLRNHQERSKKASLQHVRDLERELFSEEDWIKIQNQIGREFGIGKVAVKLEEMFGSKVRENVILLKKSLRDSMQIQNEWMINNPSIEDPIGTLHDIIIYRFSDLLDTKIRRSNQSGQLVDLQTKLEADIQKAVPEFMPFLVDEGVPEGYQSFWKSQGFHVDHQDRVFVDTLLGSIHEYTSRRNPDEIDSRAIMRSYQEKYVNKWDTITKHHVISLWAEVDKLLLEVAKEVCGENVVLRDTLLERLDNLTYTNKSETSNFIQEMINLFSSSPEDLICPSKFRLKNLKDEAYRHYHKHLNQSWQTITTNTGSSGSSSPASSVPRLLHDIISPEDREKCARFQANIGLNMMSWAIEFSSIVGKQAQSRITERFTKNVAPALRKGMQLDQVTENVRKRAGDLFESDKKKKKDRVMRMKEMTKLSEIQQHLDRISEF
ncbi:uncharacterized protein I206_104774 [Kwoniella pini CBS 10737]|uniref:Dynamin N-terminal domain-containing protein n=1 Tax=Kwoniella pini CBS 10737 TaxID=1296096 RepID=A0A1B9I7T0_9TREE|nr:uncharacterized protein I206_02313 [Kwoniella pini CBS 10737]OCF51598.1 hypothetical protein I206_02313 [Kwoniella pini CBS 10737]